MATFARCRASSGADKRSLPVSIAMPGRVPRGGTVAP